MKEGEDAEMTSGLNNEDSPLAALAFFELDWNNGSGDAPLVSYLAM